MSYIYNIKQKAENLSFFSQSYLQISSYRTFSRIWQDPCRQNAINK